MGEMNSTVGAVRLYSVIEQGRTRLLGRQALQEGFLAASMAMVGVIILLVMGTKLFPVWLSFLVGLGSFLVGVFRCQRTSRSRYVVARDIDDAWATSDQLSTAYYFLGKPTGSGWVLEQRARAEGIADKGDIAAAFPYHVPRTAWILGVTTLLMVLAIITRMNSQGPFSLSEPLPMLVAESLSPKDADSTILPNITEVTSDDKVAAVPLESDKKVKNRAFEDIAENQKRINRDGHSIEISEDLSGSEMEGLLFEETTGDEMTPRRSGDDNQSEELGTQVEAGQDSGDEITQESESLLDKLRNAFQDMLASLNMESPQLGPSSSQTSRQQSDQGIQTDNETQGVPGAESAFDGTEASSDQASSNEIGEQFSVEEGSDGGAQQQGEHSVATAGSGEGSKKFSDAKRNETMGELKDLFQRRSEELQGEFTIEADLAKQTARVPYSRRESGHRDLGTSLSRDEIPIAYRTYVQRYFEMIRQKAKE